MLTQNQKTLADLTSVRFLAQLKNISREDMEKFVEKAVCLHPHLQSLLPPDEAILSSPPAHADVPPWCQCGHCRARRSSYAVANGQDCILQTTGNLVITILDSNLQIINFWGYGVLIDSTAGIGSLSPAVLFGPYRIYTLQPQVTELTRVIKWLALHRFS